MQLELFEVEPINNLVTDRCRNMIACCSAKDNLAIIPLLTELEYATNTPLSRISPSLRGFVSTVRENIGCVLHAYYDDSVVLSSGAGVVSYVMSFESLLIALIRLAEVRSGHLYPSFDSPYGRNMATSYRKEIMKRLHVDRSKTI